MQGQPVWTVIVTVFVWVSTTVLAAPPAGTVDVPEPVPPFFETLIV